jgi:hypothetical protein
MSELASPHFDEYRAMFPARTPDLSAQRFPDEIVDMSSSQEVSSLVVAPRAGGMTAEKWGDPTTKHLWLIAPDDVRVAVENGHLGKTCARGRLAHTNLFGAVVAHGGGEVWFRDETHVWLNGGSGRYPARSAEELESCADGFRKAGYRVCCFGWDAARDAPARVLLEGAETWT